MYVDHIYIIGMYHGNSNVVIWDYIVVNNGVLEGLNGHISGWVLWLMGILLKQCNIMLISMVIMWATQCHKQLLFGDCFYLPFMVSLGMV